MHRRPHPPRQMRPKKTHAVPIAPPLPIQPSFVAPEYKQQFTMMQQLFSETWHDEDLYSVLQEVNGNVDSAIVRITEGNFNSHVHNSVQDMRSIGLQVGESHAKIN